MKTQIFSILFIQLLLVYQILCQKALTCSSNSATSTNSYYCLPVDSSGCSECAAGVKYFCPTSPLLSTGSWKKGVKVLNNCGSIARFTAIATFNSIGKYQGHAGVFSKCLPNNQIEIYDQYNGKTWGQRILWNTSGSVSNNPNEFYVVMV